MDFNLKGSQINLVVRRKEESNPRSRSYKQQHKTATFLAKRNFSPFQCRPQSADPRFRRKIGNICGHCSVFDHPKQARFSEKDKCCESVASSDLLQLLLDQPIKRPWLIRGSPAEGASSPEAPQSESCKRGTERKHKEETRENIPRRTLSSVGRQIEGIKGKPITIKMNHNSEKHGSGGSAKALPPFDYWHSSTYSSLCNAAKKDDLPGRVSFSNANKIKNDDDDFSDCDNDKETKIVENLKTDLESISTPGPLIITKPVESTIETTTTLPKTATTFKAAIACEAKPTSGSKKMVHFGGNDKKDILAKTYEYPKCPSANCTCTTDSSSTTSASLLNESLNMRDCTCAILMDNVLSLDANNAKALDNSIDILINETVKSFSSSIIEEDGEEVAKEIRVWGKPTESKTKTDKANDSERTAINLIESKMLLETQNDLSDVLNNKKIKKQNLCKREIDNQNQVKDLIKSDINNFEEIKLLKTGTTTTTTATTKANTTRGTTTTTITVTGTTIDTTTTTSSTNTNTTTTTTTTSNTTSTANLTTTTALTTATVSENEEFFNNCLKEITAISKNFNKKPENKTNHCINSKPTKPKSKPFEEEAIDVKMASKIVVEDRNLSEFNMDKIDIWMSIHDRRELPGNDKNLNQLIRNWRDEDDGAHDGARDDDDDNGDNKDENDGEKEIDLDSEISMKSDNSSQNDTTYEEIVSIIKEIEEDKKKDNFAQAKIDKDLINDYKKDNDEEDVCDSAIQSEKAVTLEGEKSPDKYRDILNYLDDVEVSCDKTLLETRRSIPESNRSEIEFVVEPDIVEDVPKLSELLMLPNHQLARRVVALSLRANELANAVYLSKEHITKIRLEKQKSIRNEKANAATRMRDQKKHYENIVARHQGFIEQLLKDKGSLCEKVAALTRRLESQNQAWEHKLATEVQRVKETTLTGEKIRRERWVRENTKKIKELTVKGLEMEINKMTCTHQREITELKSIHQQQLLDALEEARLKHEKIESAIRDACTQEREAVIEKERIVLRERFEHQLEEEKKLFDEQKQKICEDFAAERERLQNELRDKDLEYQNRRQEILRDKEQELQEAVAELKAKLSKQEEKYQNRISTIEKQYEADYEIWKRDYESAMKVQQVEKENMMRQHYRAERDRQIDVIVSRMDSEALKNAEEFEIKINRLKEKHEQDLLEAEAVEKSLREKYTDARNRLAESDAQVRNQQAEIKQLQIELEHSKKMCSEFLNEREQLRQNLRNEIQNEMITLKSEHNNDIQKIHKRVQQAIEKKDATIEILRGENGTLRERCIKLEAIIRQQRKDYCVK